MNPYTNFQVSTPFKVVNLRQKILKLGHKPAKAEYLEKLLVVDSFNEVSEPTAKAFSYALTRDGCGPATAIILCGLHWEAATTPESHLPAWTNWTQRCESIAKGDLGRMMGVLVYSDALVGDSLGNTSRVLFS